MTPNTPDSHFDASKKGNMEILLNILLYAICSIPILAIAALAYLLMTPRTPAVATVLNPSVTWAGILCMQVCVPVEWSDSQVDEFAETMNPCGTVHGWHIRRQGHEHLSGCDERVKCEERDGYSHIMLDA